MDEGIFFLVIIALAIYFFVTVVIPFLIKVVLPILGLALGIFVGGVLIYTLGRAFSDMFGAARAIVKARKLSKPVPYEDEAQIAYLMGPVREDVGMFFRNTWNRNQIRVKEAGSRAQSEQRWLHWSFYAADAVFAATFGSIGVLLASSLVAALLGIAACFLATFYFFSFGIDRLFLSFRGLFSYCPECNHRSFHLFYDCPHCTERTPIRHKHLMPNRAGALYHTCLCGHRVPSHSLTGRGVGMNAYCTLHEHPINEGLVGTKTSHIALVGAPDSGKTTLMTGLLGVFLADGGSFGRIKFTLEDEVQRSEVMHWIKQLNSGRHPPKTDTQRQRATTLIFRGRDDERRSIYIFDAAGEVFSGTGLKASHNYFNTQDTIIFVVDPLSNPMFRKRAEAEIGRSAVMLAQPSTSSAHDVLSGLIELLERMDAPVTRGLFTAKMRVIISKSDLCNLQETFSVGGNAVENWLQEYGEEAFLRLMRGKFATVSYGYAASVIPVTKNRTLQSFAVSLLDEALYSKRGSKKWQLRR